MDEKRSRLLDLAQNLSMGQGQALTRGAEVVRLA